MYSLRKGAPGGAKCATASFNPNPQTAKFKSPAKFSSYTVCLKAVTFLQGIHTDIFTCWPINYRVYSIVQGKIQDRTLYSRRVIFACLSFFMVRMRWGIFKQKLFCLRVMYFFHVLLDCNLFEISISYSFGSLLCQQPAAQFIMSSCVTSRNTLRRFPIPIRL